MHNFLDDRDQINIEVLPETFLTVDEFEAGMDGTDDNEEEECW
jgi:hypothetical protein